MRVAVLSWGTRGDVQPLLTLALQLQARGDDVIFGAPPEHATLARQAGLQFRPLGTPLPLPAYRALMDRMHAEPNPRRQNRALLQQVLLADLDRLYTDCLQAAAGADLVLGHWLQVGAGLAAEKHGLPWISVTLNAAGIGCEQSLAGRGEARMRQAYSSWLWGDRLQQFRAVQGLRAVDNVAESVYSETLNLVAMSRHLVAPDDTGWAAQHQLVGFIHGEEVPAGWQPEPRLLAFLSNHGPAVVVSLGSSAGAHMQARLQTVLAALAGSGLPVVVQALLADTPALALPRPGNMLQVGDVPHGWLFRHACCVVHHGGAGTTAAVVRAGVPSVVIGNLFDQPYWGQLLAARGLAAPPIVEQHFDAGLVADRLHTALGLAAPCQQFRRLAADEPGAAGAAARVHHAMQQAAPLAATSQ